MKVEHEIREIVSKYVKDKYFEYLNSNNLYLIDDKNIHHILNSLYDEKEFKRIIRTNLKAKLSTQEYVNSSVENIIFEICSDKKYLMDRLIIEIEHYQNSKIKELSIPFKEDGGLGLSLKITNFGIEISNKIDILNSLNDDTKVFIYKINDKCLQNNNIEELKTILSNIKNNSESDKNIKLTLYIF